VPHAALVRKNWEYKPNMQAFRDLVFGQWWTDETGRTDADGAFTTRGFLGEYKVSVTHGGKTQTQAFTLAADGTEQRVVFDE
jgi:hypothetical protein